MRRSVFAFLVFIVTAYAGASWYFSDLLIDFPTYSLAEEAVNYGVSGAEDFGLPTPEEVTIISGDVELSGWYFANTANCGVVLLHGRLHTRIDALSFAPMFWERGCSLLAFDARKHGSSGGRYATYGYLERFDTQAVLDYFAERTGLAMSQIGLVGESYGGATALLTAVYEPDLAFVAADSSYASLRSIVLEQAVSLYGPLVKLFIPAAFWLAERRAGFDIDEVAPRGVIDQIRAPIFLQHSLQDSYTPSHHATELFELADSEKDFLYLSDWDAPHTNAVNVNPKAYGALMDDFLTKYVPQYPVVKGVE